jgi:putative hydrolase of HD superfamily
VSNACFLIADKKNLQGFFDSTKGKFQHPAVKAWAEALYEEREVLKNMK